MPFFHGQPHRTHVYTHTQLLGEELCINLPTLTSGCRLCCHLAAGWPVQIPAADHVGVEEELVAVVRHLQVLGAGEAAIPHPLPPSAPPLWRVQTTHIAAPRVQIPDGQLEGGELVVGLDEPPLRRPLGRIPHGALDPHGLAWELAAVLPLAFDDSQRHIVHPENHVAATPLNAVVVEGSRGVEPQPELPHQCCCQRMIGQPGGLLISGSGVACKS